MRALVIEKDMYRRAVLMEMLQYLNVFDRVDGQSTLNSANHLLLETNIIFITIESEYEYEKVLRQIVNGTKITVIPIFNEEELIRKVEYYLKKPITLKEIEIVLYRLFLQVEQRKKLAAPMELHINLLHHLNVVYPTLTNASWRTRKVKELFAYLIHFQKTKYLKSTYILDMLWPEKTEIQAKRLLHTTVYQLRKLLESLDFEQPIVYKHGAYELRIPVKTDVEVMQQCIRNGATKEHLRTVVENYKGEYLSVENYHWTFKFRSAFNKLLTKYIKEGLRKYDGLNDLELVQQLNQLLIQLSKENEGG